MNIDDELLNILEVGPKGEVFMAQVDLERSRYSARKAYLDNLRSLAKVDSIVDVTDAQYRTYYGALSDAVLTSIKRGLSSLEEIEKASTLAVTNTAEKGGMPKRTV